MSLAFLIGAVLYGSVLGCVFVLIHLSRFNLFCARFGVAGGLLGLGVLALLCLHYPITLWRLPEILMVPTFFLTGYAVASPVGHVFARFRASPVGSVSTDGYLW